MPEDERTEIAISTPAGGGSIKSKQIAEVIAVLSLAALGFLGYVLYEHKRDAVRGADQLTEAIKDLSKTNTAMVHAQREMNCLIAMPADKREAEYQSPYSLCKRLAQ